MEKPERNAPCWCGSGRKYKVCHAAFDDKLKKINALTSDVAAAALQTMFDENAKAVSLVGNTDKALTL